MTTQNAIIDLTGRPTLAVRLNVDRPTRRAIAAMLEERERARRAAAGEPLDTPYTPDVPQVVVLLLRESALRDQARWERERQTIGVTDPVLWTAQLMQDRGEVEYDIDLLQEVVKGMDPATMAQMQQAYITGRLMDPKVLGQATGEVTAKFTQAALLGLAGQEGSPFLPVSTESSPGNATASQAES